MLRKLAISIETIVEKVVGGNFQILPWYGWTDQNTCVISYFNQNTFGTNKNFSLEILPFNPLANIYYEKVNFPSAKRIAIGFGLFTFFWDYQVWDEDLANQS